ncbi:MAG: CehA/McbA family metallohydrolase [Steroidobacteraceae bacterium]
MSQARRAFFVASLLLCAASAAAAGREPVLKQVDLPHNYYWRELYLPQLTTGPSAAAFTPDGSELVYSMAGSLWRQRIGSDDAVELTHADAAYDYQPDISRAGGSVVFTRYDGNAMELWRFDFASGREDALTANGGVNVEPRLSPDGSMLVWVSTAGTGHFNLMIADVRKHGLVNLRPLVAPRKSSLDRYYYSAHDHAINPSWSPDGKCVFFVGNAEIGWGSGTIRSVSVAGSPGDEPANCGTATRHQEETTWAARPEVAPDGRRILFSSYHGRQRHQLWLTTVDGAAPLPLTFGDFDRRNARWSPDGSHIAYISNEQGNTALFVQEFFGGARTQVVTKTRKYRPQMARLSLDIHDDSGKRIPARVSALGSDRRWHAPANAWMHGDEAYDRSLQPSETHYFHCASPCELELPAGRTAITVQYGFRHLPKSEVVDIGPGARRELLVELAGNDLPASFGRHVNADLHVHMNYGGHYLNTPARMLAQQDAEDLDVVYDLIVNKEERFPDIAQFSGAPDPASGQRVLFHSQEYHTSLWGHLGLLHLSDHLLLPGFTAYRHTALASPWPHNGAIADLAHAQGALVGYVHLADAEIRPETDQSLSNELPADVAQGKVDYLEVMGFSDHRITAAIWYRLLNLGYRVAAGAGTDAMANYASLRGPAGVTRVFLETGGAKTPAALYSALKEGRTFVSNGPLLGLELAGLRPGGVLREASEPVPFRVALRSPVAVDHLELVHNGKVIRTFELTGDRRNLDASGEVSLPGGGWLLLRAWNEHADPLVFDLYPYATTGPIYLELPGAPQSVREDAAFFVAWMDRVIAAAESNGDYDDAKERAATLGYFRAARDMFVEKSRGEDRP